MQQSPYEEQESARRQRWELLENIDALLERPLIGLSAVWMLLLILDLTVGLGPALRGVTYAIWALFVINALIEVAIAPDRLAHIRRRWFVFASLAVPALRPLAALRGFALLRTARLVRPVGLARVISGLNRGMRTLRNIGESKGIGYVVSLTFVVMFGGSAGMYWLESVGPGAVVGTQFESYADAVWWTAMLLTAIGPDFFPQTLEGRVLGWLLALYGLAVFGYLTAAVASYLAGKDKDVQQARDANAVQVRDQLAVLNERLAALQEREDLRDSRRAG